MDQRKIWGVFVYWRTLYLIGPADGKVSNRTLQARKMVTLGQVRKSAWETPEYFAVFRQFTATGDLAPATDNGFLHRPMARVQGRWQQRGDASVSLSAFCLKYC
jgi:hypothetical protein